VRQLNVPPPVKTSAYSRLRTISLWDTEKEGFKTCNAKEAAFLQSRFPERFFSIDDAEEEQLTAAVPKSIRTATSHINRWLKSPSMYPTPYSQVMAAKLFLSGSFKPENLNLYLCVMLQIIILAADKNPTFMMDLLYFLLWLFQTGYTFRVNWSRLSKIATNAAIYIQRG
jgi:hypothetical protein